MDYLYLKALHIIFVVTWFAGLFYIVRLFIYHVEAFDKESPAKEILIEQFSIMEKRLWYGITWPSAILTIGFGLSMLPDWLPLQENIWLIYKLIFMALLIFYHLSCGHIYKKLKNGIKPYTSNQLRMWNEVATIILFAAVFLVVLKDSLDALKGVLSLIGLSIALFAGFQFYKKVRNK